MNRILLICFVLMSALMGEALAQRTVSGKVTSSADGEGLPGVTVQVIGTNTGVVTDLGGNYRIQVPEGSSTLEFSFVGFTSQRINIGNRSVVDVVLREDIQSLEEVVVTAFGIEREKRALGYSVQEVEGENLNRTNESNVINALQGKVAGVNINNTSGTLGGPSYVTIRGASSALGNNQPLFVVDGIPIDNSTYRGPLNVRDGAAPGNAAADINPNDVESINVLKGPTAAALYGSRAANGVIVITTKKGRKDKRLGVDVNSSVSFSRPLRLPKYQNEYAQGYGGAYSIIDESWGPRYGSDALQGVEDWKGETVNITAQPDNIRDFYETGVNYTNSVSLNGGTDVADYRFGYTNVSETGILPNTDLSKHNFTLNAGLKLHEKVSTRASVSYVKTNADNLGVQGQNGSSIPLQFMWLPRSINVSQLRDYRNHEGTQDATGTQRRWINYFENPYFSLYENTFGQNRDRVIGNVTFNYKPVDWLDFTFRAGTDTYSDRRTQKFAVGSDAPYSQGGFYNDQYNVSETTTDFIATLNRDLNEDFNLNVLVGHNMRIRNMENLFLEGRNLIAPGIYNASNALNYPAPVNDLFQKRLVGVYGEAQLSWRDIVFVGATARNDWSSTLPKNDNSFFYPSVNGAVVITDLLNLSGSVVDFGKIRASWAQVGNDADPYLLSTVYERPIIGNFPGTDISFPFAGTPGVTVGDNIGNAELVPEITSSWEIGADVRFLKNRIGIDFTYYYSNTRDQIVNVSIPQSTGFTSYTLNAGEIENKGIELMLNVVPVRTDNFEWNTTFNFNRNRNKVVALAEGLDQIALGGGQVLRPGYPYGTWYQQGWNRTANGDLIINPATGLPAIGGEQKDLGSAQPDFNLGFQNSISYKGFDLSILFDWRQGGKFLSYTNTVYQYAGQTEETLLGREEDLIVEGVILTEGGEVANNIPVSGQRFWKANIFQIEPSLYDASFIKLRELRLGYSLPSAWYGRTPFSNIQLAIIGRNLWIGNTGQPHIDPEVSTYGADNAQNIEYGSIPSTRNLGVNLRFSF